MIFCNFFDFFVIFFGFLYLRSCRNGSERKLYFSHYQSTLNSSKMTKILNKFLVLSHTFSPTKPLKSTQKKKKYRKALKCHESHTNFHPKPKITKAIQEKVEPPSKPTFVAAPLLTERRRYCVFSDRQKETRSSDSRLLRNRRRLHLALEEALAHYLPRQNLHRRLCVTES